MLRIANPKDEYDTDVRKRWSTRSIDINDKSINIEFNVNKCCGRPLWGAWLPIAATKASRVT